MDNTPIKNTKDRQTVFKTSIQYFNIQKENLLKRGYIITKETDRLAVFETNSGASVKKESTGVSVSDQYGKSGMSTNQIL